MFLLFFIIFKFFFKILNTLIEVEQIKKDPCPYYKNNNHYYINSIVLKKLVKCFHNYPLVYILLILSLKCIREDNCGSTLPISSEQCYLYSNDYCSYSMDRDLFLSVQPR